MNIETPNTKVSRWLPALIIIALGFALMTVVLSSYVRLAESGVGCEPWPSCYGQYQNNKSVQGVNVLTSEARATPYRMERIAHRIVTSTLGLIILFLFLLTMSEKYRNILGNRIPTAILSVTVFLAAIGPFHPNQPLPILLMGNFVGGLVLVALLLHLYLKISGTKEIHMESPLVPFVRIGMFIILLQIFWGGWTSVNFAGSSCESLFNCGAKQIESVNIIEAFNPVGFLQLDNQDKVILEDKMKLIQIIHHFLGVIVLAYFISIVTFLMRSEWSSDRRLAKDCLLVLSLVVAQFLLGISTLLVQLPLFLVLSHNFMTAVLLMFLTSLNRKMSGKSFS